MKATTDQVLDLGLDEDDNWPGPRSSLSCLLAIKQPGQTAWPMLIFPSPINNTSQEKCSDHKATK